MIKIVFAAHKVFRPSVYKIRTCNNHKKTVCPSLGKVISHTLSTVTVSTQKMLTGNG